jgi:hypothetical protein
LCLFVFTSFDGEAQSIADSVGDIRSGDPSFLDVTRVRVRQLTDKTQIDIYPLAPIPPGNEAGITAPTIYEFYMDVDADSTTGTPMEDIGYDYRLRLNLYDWNGKSWIDGSVCWDFDRWGNWSQEQGFFVPALNLIAQRFRWEFSLITLKWPSIDWILRVYYLDHWADQVPDNGHGSLTIDTSLVPGFATAASEFIEILYPTNFQTVLDSFDVLNSVDAGASIERELCGTDLSGEILRVHFSPWLNGVNYSGNPVMLGSWSWGSTPPWFVVFHELGHNFTLSGERFLKLYPGDGYGPAGGDDWHFGTNFAEAWATMVGAYAVHELYTHPAQYGISGAAVSSLQQDCQEWNDSFVGQLKTYELSPDHSRLYPDLVDGIFFTLADSFGYDIIARWFRLLQPPSAPWPPLETIRPFTDYTDAKIRSMTITAAAFSAAAGVDLRDMFKTRWDFPIDETWYDELLPEIQQMIEGASDVAVGNSGVTESFSLTGNYPNPFNGETQIEFTLPGESDVTVTVVDMLGRSVLRQEFGRYSRGIQRVALRVGALATGAYAYTLASRFGARTRTFLVLK